MSPTETTTSPDELAIGTRICDGRFIIDAVLGRGGVATVYRARTDAGERLAIKVMLSERADDPAQRERFANESRILAGLRGAPYVVDILESGHLSPPDGRPYIAMELLGGQTLDRFLRGRTTARARIGRACRVVRQVASALADLHARGLVHRDIKPENIVVEASGAVRLLDFGYAHSSGTGDLPDTAGLTRAEHRPGTYLYMAPEQTIGYPPAPSFDVYALAVTLYEALVGHPPNHELVVAEMARIKCEMREPELSIAGRVFGIPPQLEALVDEGLRRVPTERVASAAQFRDRLDEIMAELPPPSGEEPDPAVLSFSPEARVGEEPIVDTLRSPPVTARVSASAPAVAPAEPHHDARANSAKGWLWIVAAFVLSVVVLIAWWPDEGVGTPRPASASAGASVAAATTGGVQVAAPSEEEGSSAAEESSAGALRDDLPREAGSSGDPVTPEEELAPPSETPVDMGSKRPHKPRVPAPEPRPCEDVTSQAAAAAKASRWARVLQLTESPRCWTDSSQRMWQRVNALFEMGRYAECVKTGARSSVPMVARVAKQCEKKIDERRPEQ